MKYTGNAALIKNNPMTDFLQELKINSSTMKKISSALLPLCIVLGGYVVPGTNNTPLGTVLVFLITLMCFCFSRSKRLYINRLNNKLLLYFALYIIAQQMVVLLIFPSISFGTHFKSLLMYVCGIFSVLILSDAIDKNVFEKSYFVIGLIACIGLLAQAFQVYILHGLTRMIILPGMEKLLSAGTRSYIDYLYNRGRPSSFFTEPSGFANFFAPLIIILIRKRKMFIAAFISVCVLLTTSTVGIVVVAAIWSYWAFFIVDKKIHKIIAMFVFFAACIWIFNSTLFSTTVNKLLGTNLLTNERSSSAFMIIKQMPVTDIITGVGSTNVSDYVYSIQDIGMSNVAVTVRGYVNSGFGNFIMYGLWGGLLYIYLCVKMIITANKWSRLTALLIFVLSFVQTMTFNLTGIQWFVFYAFMRKSETAHISDGNRGTA